MELASGHTSSRKQTAAMFQGKQRGLVLFDRRSRLGNAPRKQVCLDGNFLVGQQADFGVEGLITGKRNLDAMLPGAYEHTASHAHEFADASRKSVIHKHSSPLRCNLQLDLARDFWK